MHINQCTPEEFEMRFLIICNFCKDALNLGNSLGILYIPPIILIPLLRLAYIKSPHYCSYRTNGLSPVRPLIRTQISQRQQEQDREKQQYIVGGG